MDHFIPSFYKSTSLPSPPHPLNATVVSWIVIYCNCTSYRNWNCCSGSGSGSAGTIGIILFISVHLFIVRVGLSFFSSHSTMTMRLVNSEEGRVWLTDQEVSEVVLYGFVVINEGTRSILLLRWPLSLSPSNAVGWVTSSVTSRRQHVVPSTAYYLPITSLVVSEKERKEK